MKRHRRRAAPFGAEPEPRLRVLAAAHVQMRSIFKAVPKAMAQPALNDIDPARRSGGFASAASASGGGAGGGGTGGTGGPDGSGGGWGDLQER